MDLLLHLLCLLALASFGRWIFLGAQQLCEGRFDLLRLFQWLL